MNDEHIRLILEIAKTRSFAEAGHRCAFSPSSVSRIVSSVENELGVKLFYRSGKSAVTLTDEMKTLLPLLQEADRSISLLCTRARELKELDVLTVVTPPSISVEMAIEITTNFADFCPENPLNQMRLPNRDIPDCLLEGRASVGLYTMFGDASHPPEDILRLLRGGFACERLYTHPGVICMNVFHPLADRPRVTLDDLGTLQDVEILFADKDPINSLSLFEAVCKSRGIATSRLKISSDAHSDEYLINHMIEQNPRYMHLSQGYSRQQSIRKVPFNGGETLRYTTFLCYREGRQSKSLSSFLDCVRRAGAIAAKNFPNRNAASH